MAETLRSSNGQIIFRNSSYGIIPDRRCEVFVGRVPRDINLKDDIVPLFRSRGRLVEFRLLVSFSGHCRGFGFAIYATKEEAREAIIAFNNYEIRSGWYLGVCWSKNKCKISLINLPKSMAPEKVAKFIYDVSDSCVPGDDPLYIVFHKSGSSVVWEHKTHRAAALNRKNITGPAASTFGPQTQVIWVDFSMQIDSEEYPIMATREGSVVKLSHTDVNLIKTYDGNTDNPQGQIRKIKKEDKDSLYQRRNVDIPRIQIRNPNNDICHDIVFDYTKIPKSLAKLFLDNAEPYRDQSKTFGRSSPVPISPITPLTYNRNTVLEPPNYTTIPTPSSGYLTSESSPFFFPNANNNEVAFNEVTRYQPKLPEIKDNNVVSPFYMNVNTPSTSAASYFSFPKSTTGSNTAENSSVHSDEDKFYDWQASSYIWNFNRKI